MGGGERGDDAQTVEVALEVANLTGDDLAGGRWTCSQSAVGSDARGVDIPAWTRDPAKKASAIAKKRILIDTTRK